MVMFLARQVRVSQKPRQRITKYLPTKKKQWDRTGRNQWGSWSQIASTKGDKSAPIQQTCQVCWGNLACFHLPWRAENYPTFFESGWWMHLFARPQNRFRGRRQYKGESNFSHWCLQMCFVVVATQLQGTNCDGTQHKGITGTTVLTGQVESQWGREVLYCKSVICRDAWDVLLRLNTCNLTGYWSTLSQTNYIIWHPNGRSSKNHGARAGISAIAFCPSLNQCEF